MEIKDGKEYSIDGYGLFICDYKDNNNKADLGIVCYDKNRGYHIEDWKSVDPKTVFISWNDDLADTLGFLYHVNQHHFGNKILPDISSVTYVMFNVTFTPENNKIYLVI